MTTLAAIELQDGSILIGSDSIVESLHRLSHRQEADVSKWIEWPNGWRLGFSGFCRVKQVLEAYEFGSRGFGDVHSAVGALEIAFSALVKEPQIDDGLPLYTHSDLLLVCPGHGVFNVDRRLAAIRITPGQICCEGSGREFAYGAFEAIGGSREGMASLEIQQRFTEALEVATRLDESSGPPVKIEKLELPQRTIKPAHKGDFSAREMEEALAGRPSRYGTGAPPLKLDGRNAEERARAVIAAQCGILKKAEGELARRELHADS